MLNVQFMEIKGRQKRKTDKSELMKLLWVLIEAPGSVGVGSLVGIMRD